MWLQRTEAVGGCQLATCRAAHGDCFLALYRRLLVCAVALQQESSKERKCRGSLIAGTSSVS